MKLLHIVTMQKNVAAFLDLCDIFTDQQVLKTSLQTSSIINHVMFQVISSWFNSDVTTKQVDFIYSVHFHLFPAAINSVCSVWKH